MKVLFIIAFTIFALFVKADDKNDPNTNQQDKPTHSFQDIFSNIFGKSNNASEENENDEDDGKFKPFGYKETNVSKLENYNKDYKDCNLEEFINAFKREKKERPIEDENCDPAKENCKLQMLKIFYTSILDRDFKTQLEYINTHINSVGIYKKDSEYFNNVDYVFTPKDLFKYGGDCEDFAFAKYVTLRKMGWKASDLRLVYLRKRGVNEAHMILVAHYNSDYYMLDKLYVGLGINDNEKYLSSFDPVFSFNEKNIYTLKLNPIN